MTPESLSLLGKKELIALVLAMAKQNTALQARVAELEARFDQPPRTPNNSSLPPSRGQKSNRPAKSDRGKRMGRAGTSRKLAENPDKVRDVFAEACPNCQAAVSPGDQPDIHAYDHIDLPPVKPVTTRVHLHSGACPCCGARVKAAAPADMPLGSPFGPTIVALAIYLHTRCQHRSNFPPFTGVKVHHFGIAEGFP